MKKRVISMIVVLAMVFSLVPALGITASADNFGREDTVQYPIFDNASVVATGSFVLGVPDKLSKFIEYGNQVLRFMRFPTVDITLNRFSDAWLAMVGSYYSVFGYGVRTPINFQSAVTSLNSRFTEMNAELVKQGVGFSDIVSGFSFSGKYVISKEDTQLVNGVARKIMRPWFCVSQNTGFWLVDSAGGFPYALVSEEVDNPVTPVQYSFQNYNTVSVSDAGLVSDAVFLELQKIYSSYQGLDTGVIYNDNNAFIGRKYSAGDRVLCKMVNGIYQAIHIPYRTPTQPAPPSTVLDPGFQSVRDNYALNKLDSSFSFALLNEFEFAGLADLPYTSVVELVITGTDGTLYPYYAAVYGSRTGTYHLDLSTGKTDVPSDMLFYHKLSPSVAGMFYIGNQLLNTPYVWAGSDPTGFDCSGFVSYVLQQSGVWNQGRLSAQGIYDYYSNNLISAADLLPGDLIFFTNTYQSNDDVTHIGIYAGADMMLNASGTHVQYTKITGSSYASKIYGYARVTSQLDALALYKRSADYALDDSFHYYTDGNDNTFDFGSTFNTQFVDNSIGTVINISGGDGFSQVGGNAITLYLDDLIYDESTKTYSSMSHSAYQLSNGDNYITVNYNYEYNFYVDYTSITYIGTTADANETYNFYYELPDGRSSSDLSAEDLLALNTQVDVLPYNRSTEDTRLRSLYHFNGNTADSSYWNYATEFTWNTGASITYLDAGQNFQGALYLDELEHDFTITLPSALGSGDFTIEWRYYQSYTAAPQTDSYVQIGTTKLLQMDGAHFKNSAGATLVDTPVGSWNALCFMRKDGNPYFFVNGVQYIQGFSDFSTAFGSDINFHFGSSQQTNKQIDDLRVLNFAAYSTSGYTPSSVQFDSNLALVLPTDSVPVADEYWDITMTGTNLLSQNDLDWWNGVSGKGFLSSHVSFDSSRPTSISYTSYPSFKLSSYKASSSYSYNYSYTVNDSGSSFSVSRTSGSLSGSYPNYAVFSTRFGTYTDYPSSSVSHSLPYGTYTFTMVSSSGDIGSLTFSYSNHSLSSAELLFNGYRIYTSSNYNSSFYRYDYCFNISPLFSNGLGNGGEFVYLALEEGTESTVSAEFVSSVVGIPEESLHTPSLAVRTDIPITSWNIGGVRPSIPEKGMVWALVEDGIISSLQIYDGQGWVDVDGRIWTGERFVPLGSYNIVTMNDLLDIIGNSPGYTPIYTENGFWKWLQEAWQNMIALLTDIRDLLSGDGGGGGGSGGRNWLDDDEDADDEDDDEANETMNIFKALMKGMLKIGTGFTRLFFNGVDGIHGFTDGVGGFFSYFRDNSVESIWVLPLEDIPPTEPPDSGQQGGGVVQ